LEIFQTYESTHEIIIGGDLNEDLTKQKNSRRLLKLWQFLIDTNLTTDHKGAIFINSDCVEVSEIVQTFKLSLFLPYDRFLEQVFAVPVNIVIVSRRAFSIVILPEWSFVVTSGIC
jgi:hypothetical protein